MRDRCYACARKFTATHHEDESVTFCNLLIENMGCDNFEVERVCRNCKHLDYSNHETCHSKQPGYRRGSYDRKEECQFFEGYGVSLNADEMEALQ